MQWFLELPLHANTCLFSASVEDQSLQALPSGKKIPLLQVRF